MKKMFPMSESNLHQIDGRIAGYTWTDEQGIDFFRKQFVDSIEKFQSTLLCKRIKELVRNFFKEKSIDKIVAFGGAFLCPPVKPPHSLIVRFTTQHATLLAIQEVWKEFNPDPALPFQLLIQDPQYSEMDEKLAKEFGMQVVNGDISNQVGWLKLDEKTLVVDLGACFPLTALVCEITRPAGIIKHIILEPQDFEYKSLEPFTYILSKDEQTVEYPALGIHYGNYAYNVFSSMADVGKQFFQEYKEDQLDFRGMDFGDLSIRDSEGKWTPGSNRDGDDGYDGFCHLGHHPTLYTRID